MSDAKKLRVAVVMGDEEHLARVAWPSYVDVRCFPANTKTAEKVVRAADSGAFDWLVVSHRFTPASVTSVLKRQQRAKFLVWGHTAAQLAARMREALSLTATQEEDEAPQQEDEAMSTTEKRKTPALRVRGWTCAERDALSAAYNDAGDDFAKLLDGFIARHARLNLPMRTTAEMQVALDEIKSQSALKVRQRELLLRGYVDTLMDDDPTRTLDDLYAAVSDGMPCSREEVLSKRERWAESRKAARGERDALEAKLKAAEAAAWSVLEVLGDKARSDARSTT